MNISKIHTYFKNAVRRLKGGYIIHSGIVNGKPYILLDADLSDAEDNPMPLVVIVYPETIPTFALNDSDYMARVMEVVNSAAPWADPKDCQYIRDLIR